MEWSTARPVCPHEFDNLKVQTFDETDYLTYWSGYNVGNINSSHGYGNITFLDKHYRPTFVVCPKLGLNVLPDIQHDCDADLQEAQITDRGTIFVTAYNLTQVDLSSVNGSATGYVYDSQVHEIDIVTSESVWKWSALDHIAFNASHFPIPADTTLEPWDYAHINSVSIYGDDIVLNARHTWEVYGVNYTSGDILWTFNGETGGDWGIVPEEATFSWQHHVRVHAYNETSVTISMFGNHNYAGANGTAGTAPSVGREHYLNLPPDGVSPLTLFTLNESISQWSDSQGSYDYTPPSSETTLSRFLSYGQLPLLREFKLGPEWNATDLQWEARFGADNEVASYRSYKADWSGVPLSKPKLVAMGNGTIFMSWNGATHVGKWEIYNRSNRNGTADLVGTVEKRGFETAVDVGFGCFEAVALHMDGASKKSDVACTSKL